MYQEWTQMYSTAICIIIIIIIIIKCIHSGWVVGWKQISHNYSSIWVVIHHMHLVFFSFVISYFQSFVHCNQNDKIFLPDFFLSMYDTNIKLFLSLRIKITDFSSQLFACFSSFSVHFLSWCMVLKSHWKDILYNHSFL